MTRFLSAVLAIALLGLLAGPAYAESALESEFSRANAEFASGDYDAAATRFRALVDAGNVSPALLYDLANADAKAGRVGAAVLGYERALALAPGDPDIHANLRQTRSAANLVAPEATQWQQVAAGMTVDGWTWVALLALWTACGLGIAHALRADEEGRPGRAWFGALALSLAVAAACGALAATRLGQLQRAVALGPAPALRVAPFDESTISAELVAGQLVDVERAHEAFRLVRTTDGQAGWVPASEVGEILPR